MPNKRKDERDQKTITAGSDAGGGVGMLVPPDRGDRKKDGISKEQADAYIESIVRGSIDAIMDRIHGSSDYDDDDSEYDDDEEEVYKGGQTRIPKPQPGESSTGPNKPESEVNSETNPVVSTPSIPAQQIVDSESVGEAVIMDLGLGPNFPDSDGNYPNDPYDNYRSQKDAVSNLDDTSGSNSETRQKRYEPSQVPESVPNYHLPKNATSRICGTCKFYQAIDADHGNCYAFRFIANHDYTCDAWEPVETSTNGVDSARNPILDDDGNIIGEGLKADDIPSSADKPNNIPDKYSGIDFTVTKKMAENARRALEVRQTKPESQRGMTPVGIQRATQLANRQAVTPEIWRKMYEYFVRHEVDKKGDTWDEQGKGWQAWMGWGGDEGFEKAKRVVQEMDEADEKATAKALGVSVRTVKEWSNQDCPDDIKRCDIYKRIRANIRRDVTERGNQWGAYDSLRLRKEYKQALEDNNKKSALGLNSFQTEHLIKSIEDEVLNQGGEVKRVKTASGVTGYDQYLGPYTAKDLQEWLDEEWVNIRKKRDDGSYEPCGERTAHGTVPKCLPKSKADKLAEDERQKLIRRKSDNPEGTASNELGDLRKSDNSKSVDEAAKLVNCDDLPPDQRASYPECSDDYESDAVTYHVGYHPYNSKGDGNQHDESDENNAGSDSDQDNSGSNSNGSDGGESSGSEGEAGGTTPQATGGGTSGSTSASSGGSGGGGSTGGGAGGATASEEIPMKPAVKPAQKAVRKIVRQAGPEKEYLGAEMVDPMLEQTSLQDANIPFPERYAHRIKPELSFPHGRRKTTAPLYLPGDRVYSDSMRSLGEVTGYSAQGDDVLYTIKLLDKYGGTHGQAVVHEEDLTPRSVTATKRVKVQISRDSIKNMVSDFAKEIKNILDRHDDFNANPVSHETLNDLEDMARSILSSPDFDAISSEMEMRKYVRAMQDIMHIIGGTIHILHGAEDVSGYLDDPNAIQTLMERAQYNVNRRLVEALSRAQESLLEDTPMRTARRRRR